MTLNRKPNRLQSYDYATEGYYFVTICVENKICCFGEVIREEMVLNKYGKIINQFWKEIPKHYQNVVLDEFVVMPNHLHGIIIIEPRMPVGEDIILPHITGQADDIRPYTNLSKVIGYFKQAVSKSIRSMGLPDFSWQRSFYDHVIRKEESLNSIRQYILDNPRKWALDKENPMLDKGG